MKAKVGNFCTHINVALLCADGPDQISDLEHTLNTFLFLLDRPTIVVRFEDTCFTWSSVMANIYDMI